MDRSHLRILQELFPFALSRMLIHWDVQRGAITQSRLGITSDAQLLLQVAVGNNDPVYEYILLYVHRSEMAY